MGSLLVVTGPPGAGKSTLATHLARHFDPSVLIEGDAFFGFLAQGAIPPWLPDSNEQNTVVTRAAAAAAGRYVVGGYATVYDGVVGPWFMETFAADTGLEELHYVILLPPVDVCLDRVDTRVGHGFRDPAATRKMHHEFSSAGIDPRYVLVDPPDTVDAVVDVVLTSMANGGLLYRAEGRRNT